MNFLQRLRIDSHIHNCHCEFVKDYCGHLARILLSFVLAFTALTVNATNLIGSTPGQFAVSPSGAATYSIPIQVPPGIAGMQPELSLNYNSQSGNGLLGVGWSLGGLSAITRCPHTLVQDGPIRGIQYSRQDRLCLDGQRLVLINDDLDEYGQSGTEYRTEIESFSKIEAYGSTGYGPERFKVQTKAGQILEYGYTTDSRIEAQGKTEVAVWALNKISDTSGNYLTITYTEDNANGDYYPKHIDYTGNGS